MSTMIVSTLNPKTTSYDKAFTASSIQIACGDTILCMQARDDGGVTMHVSGRMGQALVVYPQAANSITVRAGEYA